MITSTSIFKDTPILPVDWKYNLNVIKDIKATEDFLDRKDKGCSSVESYENCTTREYLDKVLKSCGCLPLSMISGLRSINESLCHPDKLQCLENINLENSECLQKCEGLLIAGYDKAKFDENEKKAVLFKVIGDYKEYKTDVILSFSSDFEGLNIYFKIQ